MTKTRSAIAPWSTNGVPYDLIKNTVHQLHYLTDVNTKRSISDNAIKSNSCEKYSLIDRYTIDQQY